MIWVEIQLRLLAKPCLSSIKLKRTPQRIITHSEMAVENENQPDLLSKLLISSSEINSAH